MSVGNLYRNKTKGFTIVELLIVIVVIGILAAIVIVAYNGVQQRARDSRRQNDVQALTQALEIYYLTNGSYPAGSGSSAAVGLNSSWSTTADGSWANLVTVLKPIMGNVPSDPTSTTGVTYALGTTGYNYSYYSANNCNASGANQFYILVYRLETVAAAAQPQVTNGDCPSGSLSYSNVAWYRSVK
jgi:type II secretion system protein G